MSSFRWEINKVVAGGPYSTIVFKDGVGVKAAVGYANIGAAMDGIKADIGAALVVGETVDRVSGITSTTTP